MVEASKYLRVTANTKLDFVNLAEIPAFQEAMEMIKRRLIYEFHGEGFGPLTKEA